VNFKQLPFAIADGAHNMAADELLLRGAVTGRATLRFYGWTEATLSLGYFQHSSASRAQLPWSGLPWVRRPTGGATLVHHHELTYALSVPLSPIAKPRAWMADMHRIIARALEGFGVHGQLLACSSGGHSELPMSPETEALCFAQPAAGDLLMGPHKLLGSSQRKHHQALLQHGALLLAQSPFTPGLPGIKELAGVDLDVEPLIAAIVGAFAAVTGYGVEPTTWSPDEERMIEQLAVEKYGRAEWNERR
jgi:lipoate-protein ligase A